MSSNWKNIITEILPKLDKSSRKSVYEKILSKRNISSNFTYTIPDNLRSVLSTTAISNKELEAIAIQMLKFIESKPSSYDAMELADKTEAMLDYLDRIDIGDHFLDQKSRKSVKHAFLYDLAALINNTDLIVKPGIRQLNADIIKTYFKEVFIKQKIQERNFYAWDSTDIDFQEYENLPNIIKKEAKHKKFFVIESEKYWFLIGIADKPRQNPYSIKRFLYEHNSGNNMFVYLTHIVIRKQIIDKERYIEHLNYCMSRLYTLDVGVSDTIIKFIKEAQHLCKIQIEPLLKKELKKDGDDTEYHIYKRMNEYEQQITILILNKLTHIIKNAIGDENDRDYLFYYMSKIFDKMINNMQKFQLQPIATYSYNVEIMIAKLISFRHFLNIMYDSLADKSFEVDTLTDTSKEIVHLLKEKFDYVEESLGKLNQLQQKLDIYYETKENGSVWQKIIIGRLPNYTLEDIEHSKDAVNEEFFLDIIRLAKTYTNNMIYLEFDCNEILNEYYRHYAIADEKMVITRLPKVLRLPEDKKAFNAQEIKKAINHNVFIAHKAFS